MSIDADRQPDRRSEFAGPVIGALLLLYLVWGSTYLAIRVALDGFPPLLMSGLRFVLAGGFLLVVAKLRGHGWPTWAQWGASLIVGLLLCTANALVTFAEQTISSGLTAVVIASVPLWVALVSGFFGRWNARGEWVGLLVGLAGVLVLNLGGELRASPGGALLVVLSTWAWALGSVWGRRLPLPKGLQASGAQMFSGGLVLLALSVLRGDHFSGMPGPRALFAFAYLTVFGSIIAFSTYVWLLERVRPTLATSYAYVNPVVAVLLGAWLLGEPIAPAALGALALILAGVAIVASQKSAVAPVTVPLAATAPAIPLPRDHRG